MKRDVLPEYMTITAPGGDVWGVPTMAIARHRAAAYAHEFGGDIEKSLVEDTLPLFHEDDYEVFDWACNNMNCNDLNGNFVLLYSKQSTLQEAWISGEFGFRDNYTTTK